MTVGEIRKVYKVLFSCVILENSYKSNEQGDRKGKNQKYDQATYAYKRVEK